MIGRLFLFMAHAAVSNEAHYAAGDRLSMLLSNQPMVLSNLRNSYAASNPDEFFAELTMWYFGTHGDLHITGPKPDNGPDGLKKYDPEAFALLDEFYSGRMTVARREARKRKD